MGDRATSATRAQAQQAAIEVLAPETRAIGDLAVAAKAAGEADKLRVAARAKGQQLIEAAHARAERLKAEAEVEIERRFERWRQAWRAARKLGWTTRRLGAKPINQQPPPMTRRPRKAKVDSDTSAALTTPGTVAAETADDVAAVSAGHEPQSGGR
jgi:hypothetical protein